MYVYNIHDKLTPQQAQHCACACACLCTCMCVCEYMYYWVICVSYMLHNHSTTPVTPTTHTLTPTHTPTLCHTPFHVHSLALTPSAYILSHTHFGIGAILILNIQKGNNAHLHIAAERQRKDGETEALNGAPVLCQCLRQRAKVARVHHR